MLRDVEHARGERNMLRYRPSGDAIETPTVTEHAYKPEALPHAVAAGVTLTSFNRPYARDAAASVALEDFVLGTSRWLEGRSGWPFNQIPPELEGGRRTTLYSHAIYEDVVFNSAEDTTVYAFYPDWIGVHADELDALLDLMGFDASDPNLGELGIASSSTATDSTYTFTVRRRHFASGQITFPYLSTSASLSIGLIYLVFQPCLARRLTINYALGENAGYPTSAESVTLTDSTGAELSGFVNVFFDVPAGVYTAVVEKRVNARSYTSEPYSFTVPSAAEFTLTQVSTGPNTIRFGVAISGELADAVREVRWLAYGNLSDTGGYDPNVDEDVGGFTDNLGAVTDFEFDMPYLTIGRWYHTFIELRFGYERGVRLPLFIGQTASSSMMQITGYTYSNHGITLEFTDATDGGVREFTIADANGNQRVFPTNQVSVFSLTGSEYQTSFKNTFSGVTTLTSQIVVIQVVRNTDVVVTPDTAAATQTSITLEFSFPGLVSFEKALTEIDLYAYASSNASTYDIDTDPNVHYVDSTLRSAPSTFNVLVDGIAPWTSATPVWQHLYIRLKFGDSSYLVLPVSVTQSLASAPDAPTMTRVSSTASSLTFAITVGGYNNTTPDGAPMLQFRTAGAGAQYGTYAPVVGTDMVLSGLVPDTVYDVRVSKGYVFGGTSGIEYAELLGSTTSADSSMVYGWDFSALDYTIEQVGGAAIMEMHESDGSTFRSQYVDEWGQVGIVPSKHSASGKGTQKIQVANMGQPFPLGTFDSFSRRNITFRYDYSVIDSYYVFNNLLNEATSLFIEPSLAYKFGTQPPASNDRDDPAMMSGLQSIVNCKDTRQFQRAMLELANSDPMQINSYRPGHTSFHNENKFGWRCIATQGQFQYNVTASNHQLAFGLYEDSGTLRFWIRHNKIYFENIVSYTADIQLLINRHVPFIEFREREGDALMTLKSIRIYNRKLEASEFDELIPKHAFKYHHIVDDRAWVYTSPAVITILSSGYECLKFDQDATIYPRCSDVSLLPNIFAGDLFYEFQLEFADLASTFAVEFFNNTDTGLYTSAPTTNYFDSGNTGIALGINGSANLTYKAGNTLVDTAFVVPLATSQRVSFFASQSEVKFYLGGQLVGTVLRAVDSSFWDSTANTNFYMSVFSFGGIGNRIIHLVKHASVDLGTEANTL